MPSDQVADLLDGKGESSKNMGHAKIKIEAQQAEVVRLTKVVAELQAAQASSPHTPRILLPPLHSLRTAP